MIKARNYKINKSQFIKDIEQQYCKEEIVPESQKSDIEFTELEFGESLVYDYYKYGKLLKKKMYEYNKKNGLHLSRSKRQIKINDIDVEKMTQMEIKDLNVYISN